MTLAVAKIPNTNKGFVVLNTTVTLDLYLEGWLNDLIVKVNKLRRDSNLHVSDKIALRVSFSNRNAWLQAFRTPAICKLKSSCLVYSLEADYDNLDLIEKFDDPVVGLTTFEIVG